jgi:hypothetical protein
MIPQHQGTATKVVNIMEGLLEVLARLMISQPGALSQLLDGDGAALARRARAAAAHFLALLSTPFRSLFEPRAPPFLRRPKPQPSNPRIASSKNPSTLPLNPKPSKQQPTKQPSPKQKKRFMDRWLAVAGARYMEEALGMKTLAMLGRFRRRIAALALCALLRAGAAPPALAAPDLASRAAGLLARAAAEEGDFRADVDELDGMDFKADLAEDSVLARRLQLAQSDVVRGLSAAPLCRDGAAALAAAVGGEAALLAAVGAAGGAKIARAVEALLGGGLGGGGQ